MGRRLLSAVATISIARILGPKSFGEFGMVKSTVQVFSVYAAFRLGNTAAKYVAEYKRQDPDKAARILKLILLVSALSCGFISLILLASSRFIAGTLLENEQMVLAIAIGAFMLFFTIYGNIRSSALAGFENFKAIEKSNIIKGILTPLICIPLAYYLGIEEAILGLAIVGAVVMHLLGQYIKTEMRSAKLPKVKNTSEIWTESSVIWQFALPGFLSGVITSGILWTGRIILTRQEAGFTELGLFTAADQWRTLVLFFACHHRQGHTSHHFFFHRAFGQRAERIYRHPRSHVLYRRSAGIRAVDCFHRTDGHDFRKAICRHREDYPPAHAFRVLRRYKSIPEGYL